MQNHMTKKVFRNSKLLHFLGVKSEIYHSGHAPNDPINIATSTPTPGHMVTKLGGAAHATHARHHLMAKDSNPKFEFLNDSAWDRRNIEAFYMKQS